MSCEKPGIQKLTRLRDRDGGIFLPDHKRVWRDPSSSLRRSKCRLTPSHAVGRIQKNQPKRVGLPWPKPACIATHNIGGIFRVTQGHVPPDQLECCGAIIDKSDICCAT